MPLSPHDMRAAIVRKMPERTGKTAGEWIELVRAEGLAARGGLVRFGRVPHRVALGSAGEVDDELRGWLLAAFEHASG